MRPKYQTDIENRIDGMAVGAAFSAVDFLDLAGTDAVNQALSRLNKDGKIRRVIQGIYDKPEYSELLGEYSSPRVDSAADALARKFNWTIVPFGDTALNLLHVSTQVPNVWIYVSDGPYRRYTVGNYRLEFRRTRTAEIAGYHEITNLLIQAIRALGQDGVNNEMAGRLKKQITPEDKKIVLEEARTSSSWIYEYIKAICGE